VKVHDKSSQGSSFSGFGASSFPGNFKSKDFEIHDSSIRKTAPVCDKSFTQLLGAKPVDGLRLSQSLWAKSENLFRSASHVLGTAEFFLSAVGALLQGKEGDDLAEVKFLLLQVDQALGSSQCLLMGTLANFTLSKRSLYSEQLPFGSPFQNGDQQIYQSLYSSRYVDHQTEPFGCLFPYLNFFGFQEISPICLEQQGLPVSGCPVWPGGCTTGFYSGFSYSVGSSSFLSGRFSSEGIRFRNSFSSYLPVHQTSSGPRLPYFLEKVSDTSFPRLPVFGGTLQDSFRSDFPPEEKFQSLCQKIFSNSPSVTARQFSQLLGFLNSLADVVPLGRLHIRPLQFFLQEH
jgi:hypothetical protein